LAHELTRHFLVNRAGHKVFRRDVAIAKCNIRHQMPETNSIVDIGYHYVALNGSGQPIDANSNGIPDYLENPYGPVPPNIITQPVTEIVAPSNNVTFTVIACGDPTLTYQWALNGTNISGATTSSYTTNNVQLGDDG
jgi:hypothetical protein